MSRMLVDILEKLELLIEHNEAFQEQVNNKFECLKECIDNIDLMVTDIEIELEKMRYIDKGGCCE